MVAEQFPLPRHQGRHMDDHTNRSCKPGTQSQYHGHVQGRACALSRSFDYTPILVTVYTIKIVHILFLSAQKARTLLQAFHPLLGSLFPALPSLYIVATSAVAS